MSTHIRAIAANPSPLAASFAPVLSLPATCDCSFLMIAQWFQSPPASVPAAQLRKEDAFDSAGPVISNPHQGRLKPGFPEIFLEKFEILLGPMSDLMRQHHDLLVTLVQTAAHSGFLEKTLEITLAVMRCIAMRIQQDAVAANPANAWAEDHPEGEVLRLVTWKDNSEFHIVN
jgi:hypothetical protein